MTLLLVQMAVVLLTALVCGWIAHRIGQARRDQRDCLAGAELMWAPGWTLHFERMRNSPKMGWHPAANDL